MLVHGIAQQFEGPELLSLRLGAALRDGVRLASGMALQPDDVACAFYGDVFVEPGSRSGDLPPWDEHDVVDGLEADLLAAWWRRAAELDDGVSPPDEEGTRGPAGFAVSRLLLSRWVRGALNALSEVRFFQPVSKRMLVAELKQVRRYMDEPQVRRAARAAVGDQIGADTRVLVANSLGSVVAYETLCENPGWPVTDLVTVGSPLGLPVVFRRLSPLPVEGRGAWPGGVVRWTNVADPGDVVALVGSLASRFVSGPAGLVEDRTITNGVRMHDFQRYLTAPKTATAVAAGLQAAPA
ncbi:antibiotic ABC transporter ATP-binding protein [Streptomyces chumphonensis]|uniref:antibiotic ABC transporter ATP-binding protein n=1 Tax=Streptomyces chumphonensis TaxID=1214925 RepID=UPI0029652253|nr:antibiotic ABC transporter ATP-binding protein [Streptomyces chumphonensis]